MSDESAEIDRLRDHWHELRTAVDHTGVSVAVIQERQKGLGEQMGRIEASVVTCVELLQRQNGRLGTVEQLAARLDERMPSGRSGGLWGGIVGGVITGAGVVYQLIKGGP